MAIIDATFHVKHKIQTQVRYLKVEYAYLKGIPPTLSVLKYMQLIASYKIIKPSQIKFQHTTTSPSPTFTPSLPVLHQPLNLTSRYLEGHQNFFLSSVSINTYTNIPLIYLTDSFTFHHFSMPLLIYKTLN